MTPEELKQVWEKILVEREPIHGQEIIHTMQQILEIATEPEEYLKKATANGFSLQEILQDMSFVVHREQVLRLLLEITQNLWPEQVRMKWSGNTKMELKKIKDILEEVQNGQSSPTAKLVASSLLVTVMVLEKGISQAEELERMFEENGHLLQAKCYRDCKEQYTAAACAEIERMMQRRKLIKEEEINESK